MTTLTDRYVWAVVRAVPESQRKDIERELRASIADDSEARAAAGSDDATAERDVLLALGDPDRLAASYAQRPNMLIGPRYYFDYVRLLKVLYVIVLPIVVVVVIAGQIIGGSSFGEIMGRLWPLAISLAAHLGFWTTLVFAILDRTTDTRAGGAYSLDSLPQIPNPRSGAGLGELIATVVWLLFFAGFLFWQQTSSVFTDAAGDPIPVLQPDLWELWIPYTLVLIALELGFATVLYVLRRWTWPMAVVNVLLNAAFLIPAIWLIVDERVFNPAFLDELGWPDVPGMIVFVPIVAVVFAAVAMGDVVDGFVKAYRASRAANT